MSLRGGDKEKEEKSEEEKSAKFSKFFMSVQWYILDNQIEKLI